ncbi:hypothetical protein [Pseudoxanthomonas suwonensis]|uniref:hypothetical protein n=1 Tax=Pseudoxanthomonas suwonensis TaxID=314722 RepID=UPI000A88AF68
MTLLAPLSVLGSDLPRIAAWPLAAAAAAYGLWQLRREAGRAPRQLVLATTAGGIDTLDGQPLQACRIAWRGPLAFVHAIGHDGRGQRLAWWPDTLPRPLRRELRLAAAARAASRRDRPMAP